jgi:hypothetical protein
MVLTEWTVRMGRTWMMFHTEAEARGFVRDCPHITSPLYGWANGKWKSHA